MNSSNDGWRSRAEEYNSIRLLHLLGDEFKALKLPFKVKVKEHILQQCVTSLSHNTVMVLEICSQIEGDDYKCFSNFAEVAEVMKVPDVDFQELKLATADYFDNEQDSTNFTMGLDIKYKELYDIRFLVPLENEAVRLFIEEFRDRTESIRLKVYEENFEEEVDEHLSEDEYNKGTDGSE